MDSSPSVAAALLLGLVGGTHCIGMCGGISAALAFALPPSAGRLQRATGLLLYSAGRVVSYALLGGVFGGLAATLQHGAGGGLPVLRIAGGLLLMLMGLYLAGWTRALAWLERAGFRIWQPLQGRLARALQFGRPTHLLAAGMAWGLLPCGLVYSTLAWSASSGDAATSAALMAAFGLGTLPAVAASGALAAELKALLQRRGLRLAIALLVIAFGAWTIYVVAGAPADAHAHHHMHAD